MLMKIVYDLRSDLLANPAQVAKTQELTLNESKPLLGLRGSFGLFGSDEWWGNVSAERLPMEVCVGLIEELYFAGQDSSWGDEVNSFSMRLPDGSTVEESIVVNEKIDRKLFVVGAEVRIRYALEELKRQPAPDGGVNYLKIPLEIAVTKNSSTVTRSNG